MSAVIRVLDRLVHVKFLDPLVGAVVAVLSPWPGSLWGMFRYAGLPFWLITVWLPLGYLAGLEAGWWHG